MAQLPTVVCQRYSALPRRASGCGTCEVTDFESKVYALNTEKAVPFEVCRRAHSGHG